MQFMTKINQNTDSKGFFAKLNRYFNYNFSLPDSPLPDKVISPYPCGHPAFSLVEMLMALLVASLLLAALAPVMTRRMADHELKVISEASNYDKDLVVSLFTKDTDFNIPSDANQVRITMMGGGGKGGDALYENREITSSQEFIVPDNVTKLRVFMIGAGGGGASGGQGTAWETADIPALNNAEGEILTAGSYTFANGITPPDNYKAPELTTKCKVSDISDKWTVVSDDTTVEPNKRFTKFPDDINVTLDKVTACGGGGGQGGGGEALGGSGGYIDEISLNNKALASDILLGVGANGGSGTTSYNCSAGTYYASGGNGGIGFAGLNGSNGGQGWSRFATKTCGCAGGGSGGGGGGATGGSISGVTIFQISGGGGGGGYAHGQRAACDQSAQGSSGGNGGGVSPGLGGGGAYMNSSTRRVGSGASGYVAGINGSNSHIHNSYGGSGGGGIGGIGGGRGNLNSIFGANNCNGGKPGAIHLWYSASSVKNGLKCQYYTKSNSGAGGGSGQIWIGELSVTPGQKLNFNIGIGGSKTTSYGSNGNNGGNTSITNTNGTTLISVSGGKGGRYESDETYINNSYGIGGGIKTSNVDSSFAKYVNWKKTNFHQGGENGGVGKTPAQGAGGGKGGQLYDLNGILLKGGNESGAQTDGYDAPNTSYGAGGGGGGGVINDGGTPGYGGKGANGYIYVEWGGSNGGGGTMGEFTQKVLTNFDQTDRKMIIKIGKGGDSSINNGIGGETSISAKSGGKNVTYKARGGLKGSMGTMDTNIHGSETKYPDNYDEMYKEYVQGNMNIISGQKGEDEYGGMGGYIACLYISKDEEGNKVCNQSIKSNDGLNTTLGPIRPGCGGSSITAPLYDSICIPYSTSATPHGGIGQYGAGGGGGSVLNQTQGKGGKGGDGFVILEYKSVQ